MKRIALIGLCLCLLVVCLVGCPEGRITFRESGPEEVTIRFEDHNTGEPLSGYAFLHFNDYSAPLYGPDFGSQSKRTVRKIGKDGKIIIPGQGYSAISGEVYTAGHEKVFFSYNVEHPEGLSVVDCRVTYQLDDNEGYEDQGIQTEKNVYEHPSSHVLTPRDVTGDSEAWFESVLSMPSGREIKGWTSDTAEYKLFRQSINSFALQQYRRLKRQFEKYPEVSDVDFLDAFNFVKNRAEKLKAQE